MNFTCAEPVEVDAPQAAAYLGLMLRFCLLRLRLLWLRSAQAAQVPITNESGSSVKNPSRLSKTGQSAIHAKLYFAAITASRYIVGLLNNYIFIIIKHMILYIFYFKDSVIRL